MVTQMQIGLVVFLIVSGFTFSLGSAAITWSSKKQPTIAFSSTKAEYRVVAMVACEVAWLHTLLQQLGKEVQRLVVIYCDNLSDIQLARNPMFHAWTKHIEVHYHSSKSGSWAATLILGMYARMSKLLTSSRSNSE